MLRATALLAIAWGAAALVEARHGSAAMRFTVWVWAFMAIAALPALTWAMPALPLAVLPAPPTPASDIAATLAGRAPNSPGAQAQWIDYVQLAYVAVTLLFIGRLVLGRFLLERLWRTARPLDDSRTKLLVRLLCETLNLRRVEVRLSTRPVVPMTWGTRWPRVLLPCDAPSWPAEQWRSVLTHELAHVSRRDSLTGLFTGVVCALYWLHPAVWYAARRMRLAQEQACDDLVLDHGASAATYARHLLDSAGTFSRSRGAFAMAGPSDLEQRLSALLATRNRNAASKTFLTSAALVALAAAPAVAAVTVAPIPATVTPMAETQPFPMRPVETRAPMAAPASITPAGSIHARQPRPFPSNTLVQPAETQRPAVPDYDAKLAAYGDEVNAYRAKLERYNEQLSTYSRENQEYGRKVQAWHTRIAEIGPNPPPSVVIPSYPTAPTAPTAPTYPTAPVRPPTHLHSN
jgi:beta-lactamase regulating signal transducer with metallopeptidase domain